MTNVSTRKEPIVSSEELLGVEPTRTRAQQWWTFVRRQRWLIAAVLAPIILVWLIPVLIAHSPMLDWVLGRELSACDRRPWAGFRRFGWVA